MLLPQTTFKTCLVVNKIKMGQLTEKCPPENQISTGEIYIGGCFGGACDDVLFLNQISQQTLPSDKCSVGPLRAEFSCIVLAMKDIAKVEHIW